MGIGWIVPPVSQCHSEEPFGFAQDKLRDEESAFSAVGGSRSSVVSKQILHGVYPELCRRVQDDSIGQNWCNVTQPLGVVGWVEALCADTHRAEPKRDGYRFAPPSLHF